MPPLARRAGIGDGLVRVSVGIEATEDLVADFEVALDLATAATASQRAKAIG
jgi:cystathionine gamma-synthase